MWLILSLPLIFCSSCTYFQRDEIAGGEKPLARVNDSYLYYSDIEPVVKSAGKTSDSASVVRTYIDDWIKRKLMIQKALLYLPPENINIEKQVADYRESLLLYLYEKELILQKLDSVVTDEVLSSYFTEYKNNFILSDDILQMHYVKTPTNAPKLDSVILWMTSTAELNRIKLEDYCHQYASDFSFSDSLWHEVTLVYKNIPVKKQQLETAVAFKSIVTVSDSLFNYVLKVNDYKKKGETAPFEFVKDDIEKIILNKRKVELIRSTYENIYLEAQRSNKFEIYE
ncbi:MAG TPA: hypothetical protein VNJ07_00770 [Chitinophagales bacterium]|nr:hypothetical protein [Chitinophagales bacterium]